MKFFLKCQKHSFGMFGVEATEMQLEISNNSSVRRYCSTDYAR